MPIDDCRLAIGDWRLAISFLSYKPLAIFNRN